MHLIRKWHLDLIMCVKARLAQRVITEPIGAVFEEAPQVGVILLGDIKSVTG